MNTMGCHFAGGLDAKRRGQKRELPSYFTIKTNRNAKQWLAGWDYGDRLSVAWDEPAEATTPRGWFWPNGTTERNRTSCAGHYLDYGLSLKRVDDKRDAEPGAIHCVVIHPETNQVVAARYVESIAHAKTWIEDQAFRFGHSLSSTSSTMRPVP